MTVVNGNKSRKIIKFAIIYLAPIVFLIYVLISLADFSFLISTFGTETLHYEIAIIGSIWITLLIIILYYVSRIYPKASYRRKFLILVISLLMLIDGIMWADLGLIEIVIEGIGSISVDFTSLFIGIFIILSLNLIVIGFNLFIIGRSSK